MCWGDIHVSSSVRRDEKEGGGEGGKRRAGGGHAPVLAEKISWSASGVATPILRGSSSGKEREKKKGKKEKEGGRYA